MYRPKKVATGYFRDLVMKARMDRQTKAEKRRHEETARRRNHICSFCHSMVDFLEKVVQTENSFTHAKAPLSFGCELLKADFPADLPGLDCDAALGRLNKLQHQFTTIETAHKEVLKCIGGSDAADCVKTTLDASLGGCSLLDIGFCHNGKAKPHTVPNLLGKEAVGGSGAAGEVITPHIVDHDGKHTHAAVKVVEAAEEELEEEDKKAEEQEAEDEAEAEAEADSDDAAEAASNSSSSSKREKALKDQVTQLRQENKEILEALSKLEEDAEQEEQDDDASGNVEDEGEPSTAEEADLGE